MKLLRIFCALSAGVACLGGALASTYEADALYKSKDGQVSVLKQSDYVELKKTIKHLDNIIADQTPASEDWCALEVARVICLYMKARGLEVKATDPAVSKLLFSFLPEAGDTQEEVLNQIKGYIGKALTSLQFNKQKELRASQSTRVISRPTQLTGAAQSATKAPAVSQAKPVTPAGQANGVVVPQTVQQAQVVQKQTNTQPQNASATPVTKAK